MTKTVCAGLESKYTDRHKDPSNATSSAQHRKPVDLEKERRYDNLILLLPRDLPPPTLKAMSRVPIATKIAQMPQRQIIIITNKTKV